MSNRLKKAKHKLEAEVLKKEQEELFYKETITEIKTKLIIQQTEC